MPGRKVAKPLRITDDRAGEAQRLAPALNRLHERLPPPAEADDRRVDHRLIRSAPNLVSRGAEVLMEEREDLVPAIDSLFRAVIRAIPREERVAGSVIAVELVILAVLFQLRLS